MTVILWIFALVAVAGCIEFVIEFAQVVDRRLGRPRAVLFFTMLALAFLVLVALP